MRPQYVSRNPRELQLRLPTPELGCRAWPDASFPHNRLIGEFQELQHGRPDGPALRESVRDQASPDEEKLVGCLRSGSPLAVSGTPVHDILSSGKELIDALELHTDGEWF
jgi:hypothetical protein